MQNKFTKKQEILIRVIATLVVSYLLIFMVGLINEIDETKKLAKQLNIKSKESRSYNNYEATACLKAQSFVKSALKSPSTAKFPQCVMEAHKYEIGHTPDEKLWFVFGHVDSENGFGAMIRAKFAVKMTKEDNIWILSSIAVD